mmetsp:Transcript_73305/g.238556  ORF Transcript_73305/g.238556 Transcript_73305/m.238556 type:complete len:86 (+) Transcript_73305:1347-1604(+)
MFLHATSVNMAQPLSSKSSDVRLMLQLPKLARPSYVSNLLKRRQELLLLRRNRCESRRMRLALKLEVPRLSFRSWKLALKLQPPS